MINSEIIKAYLYNNPLLEGAIFEKMGGGYRWQMQNIPHIDIIGKDIGNGKNRIEVKVFSKTGEEIYSDEKEVEVKYNKFSIRFELPDRLNNPEEIKINLKNKRKEVLREEKVRIHRIYGRITDFNGNPIPAYVWAIPERELPNLIKNGFDGTVVQADRDGKYELWLPEEKITGIFIDDENYQKATFECWIWDVNLRRDIEINPRIDKVEIYNLRVWQSYLGEPPLHLHFIPCSLLRTLSKIPERLKRNEVKVYVNDEECKIKTFTEHKTWFERGTLFSYILDINPDKFDPNNTIVRVEIEWETEFKGKKAKEKGEAYFLGFY